MLIKKNIPRFSIITVVLNNEKFLNETIKSIINQRYKNLEYIVIDGKSTDDTIHIIKKYKNKINKFLSEKDKGIYYAFNKGIRLASGEYICFVNSDDKLTLNALNIINKYIEKY